MRSEKVSSADYQQETARTIVLSKDYLIGFIDGEGCFNVRINENPNARKSGGWSFGFSFSVSQHFRSLNVLEGIKLSFNCGQIYRKSPKSNVWVYSVTSTKKISENILPFFDENLLIVKREDYLKFRTLLEMFRLKKHYNKIFFDEMLSVAYSMNNLGKQRALPKEAIVWKDPQRLYAER